MTGPGEATAQRMKTSMDYLEQLSRKELEEYRSFIQGIASNRRYAFIDSNVMSGLTPEGKLQVIDQALEKYQK